MLHFEVVLIPAIRVSLQSDRRSMPGGIMLDAGETLNMDYELTQQSWFHIVLLFIDLLPFLGNGWVKRVIGQRQN